MNTQNQAAHIKNADPYTQAQAWWRLRCTPASGWPPRSAALRAMEACGVPKVTWGTLQGLEGRLGLKARVVAYVDPHVHQGDGKVEGALGELLSQLPGTTLASGFDGDPGVSLRVLCIGARVWAVRQTSEDSWASNLGDEGTLEARELTGEREPSWAGAVHRLLAPIWAVDLVARSGSEAQVWLRGAWEGRDAASLAAELEEHWKSLLGCDLNLAPGIQGTGLHGTLGGSVASALADWVRAGGELPWEPCRWDGGNGGEGGNVS